MITKIPIILESVQDQGFHLFVKGRINGKDVNLLLDTGASRTVFDLSKMQILLPESEFIPNEELSTGLGTNSMESQGLLLDEFQLGEIILKNYTAVALNIQHVNESYEMLGLNQIDGVLGSDVLNKYKAVIHFARKELKLTYRGKSSKR
jgi:predicted aspartyl protease